MLLTTNPSVDDAPSLAAIAAAITATSSRSSDNSSFSIICAMVLSTAADLTSSFFGFFANFA